MSCLRTMISALRQPKSVSVAYTQSFLTDTQSPDDQHTQPFLLANAIEKLHSGT